MSLCSLKKLSSAIVCGSVPQVQQSVAGILKAESALHLAEVEAAAGAWDGEVRQVSKHSATLVQLDNGVKVKDE